MLIMYTGIHHVDVICNADTIIDFGPGGGNAGGNIVATGTPQQIAEKQNSLTGKILKQLTGRCNTSITNY